MNSLKKQQEKKTIILNLNTMKNIRNILIISCIVLILSCEKTTTSNTTKNKSNLIKVTILYPNDEGKTFDMDYYATKHMPMVADLLGDSLKFLEIDKGIASNKPETPMPFLAIGYLYFDTLSAYQTAFGPNADAIINDIPNYTNIQPVVQISEVLQ